MSARHVYVHIPFCAHRCGYCAFVTVSHRPELHETHVDALLTELDLRAGELAPRVDTIFMGGGTPTLLAPSELERLASAVSARLVAGGEFTIEANPETVTAELADLLVSCGVTRVSLGAQSFTEHVLTTLERRATPETIELAVDALREAGVDNVNLDLVWGVPGQSTGDLQHDLDTLIALAPDYVSAYELEFKPGTRLTHHFGSAEDALGDSTDEYYEQVVTTLEAAGYEWYETANFARDAQQRSRHNLAYWKQRDYVGLGIGAVSTLGERRTTNRPNVVRYIDALAGGELPPSSLEIVGTAIRAGERIMLAARLAEPFSLSVEELEDVVDTGALRRLSSHGLLATRGTEVELTRRGRMLANSVVVELLT